MNRLAQYFSTTFILSLITSVLLPLQLFAWGALGHSAVGMIADGNLTPQARAGIQKLLVKASLSDVANWADSIKSTNTYTQSIWYHFEKIPDNVQFLDNLKAMAEWQQKKGGIVTAIIVAEEKIRDLKAAANEQTDALKFLVHFVGDLHQPLHTGRPDDNGGVKTNVNWFGRATSLHQVWDSAMIATGHADMLSSTPDAQVVTIEVATKIYVDYLIKKFAKQPVNAAIDVEGWLNQSLALRFAAYDPIYNTDQNQYQKLHLDEIDWQIYSGGVRLANYLNEIFKNTPVNAPTESLWKNIEKIVGDLGQVISFKP